MCYSARNRLAAERLHRWLTAAQIMPQHILRGWLTSCNRLQVPRSHSGDLPIVCLFRKCVFCHIKKLENSLPLPAGWGNRERLSGNQKPPDEWAAALLKGTELPSVQAALSCNWSLTSHFYVEKGRKKKPNRPPRINSSIRGKYISVCLSWTKQVRCESVLIVYTETEQRDMV